MDQSNAVKNVLVLCTGNSARSILGEALLNHLGEGRVRGFSAGSHPVGKPNPLALDVLHEAGISIQGLRSKRWDEFTKADAPRMDVVITVCDAAAGEACPIWPGHPAMAHWGLDDPAAVQGDETVRRAAFSNTLFSLRQRVRSLIAALHRGLGGADLSAELSRIHHRS